MYPTLLFASVAVFLFVALLYVRQDFSSVYHPITLYLLFHGLVFTVRPLFAYWQGYDFLYRVYGFNPSLEVKSTVVLAANLGLLAFVAGAWKMGNAPLVFRQRAADIAHRRRLIPSFVMVLALVAPVALASLYFVYTSGYAGLRLDLNTGVAINTISNGWILEAQLMLVPLSVLIAWMFRFRWWSLLPLLIFMAFRAGTGGRGPFIVACAAAGLLWLYDSRRRWPTPRMFALLVPLIALFYFLGQERSLVKTFLEDGKIVEIEEKTGFMQTMDWANLEFFEYLVETVPRKTGTYGYFVDNLQVFTEPVPRKLWKDKPIGAPIKMFNLFDYGKPVGMTYSLPGYGWMQLGYAGVVLWCALWGACLGAIYSRFVRGRQANFQVAFYFAFLPIFIIAFRDGGLVTVARTGVFYLTPILIWMWMTKALGIPDADEQVRRVARRTAPDSSPRPSRIAQAEIVPRAWRRRSDAQPNK
jgi:oligosaccharide repeat unit polymerase